MAGIEIVGNKLGDWIRPVSTMQGGAISPGQRSYKSGKEVALLDVIRIPFKEPCPSGCQVENQLIDERETWEREGAFEGTKLADIALKKGPLWIDDDSSRYGLNDRIPLDTANTQTSSLLLVLATNARIVVSREYDKKKTRVHFALGGTQYWLPCTDPAVTDKYRLLKDGEYQLEHPALLCVSLSEPLNGYRYKLAASVIDLR